MTVQRSQERLHKGGRFCTGSQRTDKSLNGRKRIKRTFLAEETTLTLERKMTFLSG